VNGRDLDSLVYNAPVAPATARRIVQGLCDVLQSIHDRGVIHRDVKSGNVRLNGVDPTVLDFNLSWTPSTACLDEEGAAYGTPNYMSPEAWRGEVDLRTDVYSAGVVLYELLTGKQPFEGASANEVMMLHLTATPIPPRTLATGVSCDLSDIAMTALEKDPDDRFQSAGEMADALRHARLRDRWYTRVGRKISSLVSSE
jgi:serine/threonine-protein kinase